MPRAIKVDIFRYVTNEAWRVLIAVEMGMKNHEFVPLELIHKISRSSRRGSSFLKILKNELVQHGLVAYEVDSRTGYSGYRLSNMGYDFLALHTLIKSGHVTGLGSMIGVGKESDVYLAEAGNRCGLTDDNVEPQIGGRPLPLAGDLIVIKFHRLGRTSFRKVKQKREYHQNRNACSWLYLDRIAASREFQMMKALYENDIPVPQPLAHNRNAVVMSLLTGAVPLCRVMPSVLKLNQGAVASCLYHQAVDVINNITALGFVHGDFNEFNLLVGGLQDLENMLPPEEGPDYKESTGIDPSELKLILIDFPQMISRDHKTAQEIYKRDLNGITSFFERFLIIDPGSLPPSNIQDVPRAGCLDVDLKAPGYVRQSSGRLRNRNRFQNDDSDLLVGVVDSLALCDENSEDELEKSDESSEESCSLHTDKSDNSDEDDTISTDVNSLSSKKFIVMSNEEIWSRHRQEVKRKQQAKFNLNVKRQLRAVRKTKGRADLAAEIKLFD